MYARYREAVVQMYTDLFNQHKDPLSDEFQREKRKLEGVERYLVQLWRDSLSVGRGPLLRPGRVLRGGGERVGAASSYRAVLAALVFAALVFAGALLEVAVGCFVSFWPFARKGIVA